MKIANVTALNADRTALLDAFDAVWMPPCDELTPRARRALLCAQKLYCANTTHLIGSWGGFYIAPGGTPAGRFIVRP